MTSGVVPGTSEDPTATGAPWWWPAGDVPGARPLLFLPPSGAEPSVVQPLVPHLAGVRLGVLQLPGRGSRYDEPHPRDLAALVDDVVGAVRALDGPAPVLVGHSFGGLLAYGVTCALEDAGVPPARLVTVASASPPSWADELARDRSEHPDGALVEFVARRTERILGNDGTSAAMLAHPELAARARELVGVDVQLSHHGFDVRTFRTGHTCITARDDRMLDPTATDGWGAVSGGELTRITVAGGHFCYRDAPERVAATLRMELTASDGAYGAFG